MLTRLYVNNYRTFVNFECTFGPVQLILGPNGGGKTNLFRVLETLRNFCVLGTPAESLFAGATRTRWQSVPTQTFELDLQGNGGLYSLRLEIDTEGRAERPRVVKEELLFDGRPIFRFVGGEVHLFNDRFEDKVQYPFDWHRSALATVAERPENSLLTWFKSRLGGVLFISPDPRQMSGVSDQSVAVPAEDLRNFADWYQHLRLENQDYELMEDLRDVIPGFKHMSLKNVGLGRRFLSLDFEAVGASGSPNRFEMFFHELSDGQRMLIGLYTALHFALRPGGTLFFDEPDNFVALKEIEPWLDGLLDSFECENWHGQAWFISHHPEILNRLAVAHGLVFDRPEGLHTRVRRFNDPLKTGLTAAELIARGWENE